MSSFPEPIDQFNQTRCEAILGEGDSATDLHVVTDLKVAIL